MTESLGEVFSFLHYGFIQRAFVVGIFVGATCALLGVFLVLKKMSLIGDGLSHVSFGAVALGLFWGASPLFVAVPVVLVASVAILWISKYAKLYGDAAIGVVSAIGIAFGVLLASLSGGFTVDLLGLLFGNILAVTTGEVISSIILFLLVSTVVIFLYWDLFSVTFDEEYAQSTGVRVELLDMLLAVLTGITVVLSLKIVGVMLVSAFLILPAITALQFSRGFFNTILIAEGATLFSILFGITFSFFWNIPAGATIALFLATLFVGSFLIKKFLTIL